MHGDRGLTVGGPPNAQSPPSAADVRAQLDILLASPAFDVPARARRFLSYVVEETLAGRGDRIKAYAVGMEVFGRDKNFDAQNDPAVRIEAGRIRRALTHYYLAAGLSDPIIIDIPKGAYVPHFAWRTEPVTDGPAATGPPPETPAASLPPMPRKRIMWLGAGLAALATVVLLVMVFLIPSRDAPVPTAQAPMPGGPTLVVMPFADLGGSPETKIYAQGLTEEVLSQLARFKELSVLGRETSRSIPPDADAARIRRDLGVRYVLEGSVRTAEHQLRVTGRLLDAETGAVLWSQAYDEDLRVRGFFAIQDDVAQKVATAIGQPYGIIARSDERRTQAGAPEDLEAYACTLRFYGYRAALGPASHAAIRTCLERAVDRYPSYATAWAMLSMLYLDEDRFGFNPRLGSPTATQRSIEAARLANRLDPENVRGLQALMGALFFTEQPVEALRVGERAVALNPNDTELLADFGARVGQAGDHRRGMALMEQALVRNPGHSGYYNGVLAQLAYLERDYERAQLLMRQVSLEKFPLYHFVSAIIYAQLGMKSEAAEARDRFLQARPAIFEQWDREMAKRNFRPEDATLLAEGARKAGFPVADTTAAETALRTAAPQR
ncbi:adenylate cyclase [Microvirga tunisiensis]|uniref:Adenylate cyclase n=1 Tax=Microvirga tunisiensis TaxID=2108360 RepID=A0A5N7MEW1_9HYPH|nr:adenylate cyclase [Microvirga tunisiensis]MPR06120.1 adenylate cyclase [Microvirga tunisiensis]MPR25200.1 adenylate cyclase [Microvirga tunisiensis]